MVLKLALFLNNNTNELIYRYLKLQHFPRIVIGLRELHATLYQELWNVGLKLFIDLLLERKEISRLVGLVGCHEDGTAAVHEPDEVDYITGLDPYYILPHRSPELELGGVFPDGEASVEIDIYSYPLIEIDEILRRLVIPAISVD